MNSRSSLLIASPLIASLLLSATSGSAMAQSPWQTLRGADQRVLSVLDRLNLANAAFCPDQAPATGLLLASPDQYPPANRPAVREDLDLTHVQVQAVTPGGAAQRAGLVPGDRLLAVDSERLPDIFSTGTVAFDKASADQASRTLTDALAVKRTVHVLVQSVGQNQPRTIALSAPSGCAFRALVTTTSKRSASHSSGRIQISLGMLSEVASDDELAYVLGHEMAHGLIKTAVNPPRPGKALEARADVLALRLMANGGYDPQAAVKFWQRMQQTRPLEGMLQLGHPGYRARAELLARELAHTERARP